MQILITGDIGAAGAFCIYAADPDKFRARFPADFLKLVRQPEPALWQGEAYRRYPLSKGGVFEGLWRLSKDLDCGFEVSMAAIPIRQETVEICEYAGVNPYQADSSGAELIVCENVSFSMLSGPDLTGVRWIGETKEGSRKILYRGDEIRYLERPKKSE